MTFQVNTREKIQIWRDPGFADQWYGRVTVPTGRTTARSTQHLKYFRPVKTRRRDDIQRHHSSRKPSRRKGSGGGELASRDPPSSPLGFGGTRIHLHHHHRAVIINIIITSIDCLVVFLNLKIRSTLVVISSLILHSYHYDDVHCLHV